MEAVLMKKMFFIDFDGTITEGSVL